MCKNLNYKPKSTAELARAVLISEIKFNYEGDEQDIPEMISSDEDAQLAVTKKLQAPKPRPTQPKVQTKTHVPSVCILSRQLVQSLTFEIRYLDHFQLENISILCTLH